MSDAPDFVAPVQGWRLWFVVCDGPVRLVSIVYDVAWPPGRPLVARCLQRRRAASRPWRKQTPAHAVPHERCRCGIYAAGDPFQLGAYLESNFVGRRAGAVVVGRVSLWGTVIESERGWRATYAYPSHIYVPCAAGANGRNGVIAELADYGVPVVVVTETATDEMLGALAAVAAS